MTSLAAPSSNELMRFVVKSKRKDSTLALEPIVAADERRLVNALSRSLICWSTLASIPQLEPAVVIDRPEESDLIPEIVSVELPSSLKVTFKLAGEPLIRFVPL